MIVYHGTTLEIKTPKIIKSELGRDFGFAFYTTDIQAQAERWAIRRSKILSKKQNIKVPAVVNVYEWTMCEGLKEHHFEGASLDWLETGSKMPGRCGVRAWI